MRKGEKPAADETTGLAEELLHKKVTIRLSDEEHQRWMIEAEDVGVPVNVLIRRVMGHALGILDHVEETDRRIMAGKVSRAARMRSFRSRGTAPAAPAATTARRAS